MREHTMPELESWGDREVRMRAIKHCFGAVYGEHGDPKEEKRNRLTLEGMQTKKNGKRR